MEVVALVGAVWVRERVELREAQEELPAAVASLADMRVRAHFHHSPMSRRTRETAYLQTSRLYITRVCQFYTLYLATPITYHLWHLTFSQAIRQV
jgi:hypothetical protein